MSNELTTLSFTGDYKFIMQRFVIGGPKEIVRPNGKIRVVKTPKKILGFFVATRKNEENIFNIGFSLCHKCDKFIKEEGINLALNRSFDKNTRYAVPYSLKKEYEKFLLRCKRYFKEIPYSENCY